VAVNGSEAGESAIAGGTLAALTVTVTLAVCGELEAPDEARETVAAWLPAARPATLGCTVTV
jgi:uncharacterized protein YggL (DUF469 family)